VGLAQHNYPAINEIGENKGMNYTKVKLDRKEANGYIIPLGVVNLVNVVTDVGMVGCGALM
jgi:hypothetical protein